MPGFAWDDVLIAATAAALAGLVRGFSGFGPAMVFNPVASAIYGPAVAVPILFLIDAVTSLPVVVRSLAQCRWREVLPISGGAALTIPLGVWMLVATDPTLMRWILCLTILVAVGALSSGWRYRGEPSLAAAVGVGGLSGFGGGFAGLYGPPMILFWLGGRSAAATVRANVFVFFGLIDVVAGTTFWYSQLLTRQVLTLALVLMPVYGIAMWIGARAFRRAPEAVYRYGALLLCTLAALIGLPLWG